MHRLTLIVVAFWLSGCGVETLGTATTAGAARNEEVKEAQKTQEQFRQRLDASMQAAEKQRDEAERRSGL